jgi:hypothetical protein
VSASTRLTLKEARFAGLGVGVSGLAGVAEVAGSELAVPVGVVDAGGGAVPVSRVALGAAVQAAIVTAPRHRMSNGTHAHAIERDAVMDLGQQRMRIPTTG